MTDIQLLQQYARTASQEAFAELVRRHYGWVRAAALRQVHSSATADDVAQAVFLVLARKANSMPPSTQLGPWLFQVTRYSASNAIRSERRRQSHERQAAQMQIAASTTDESANWHQLSADLDALLARLRQHHRQALLLRFYQQMTFGQMGELLGVSEDAARKRVDNALAKLRAMFERRRVSVPATALATALLTHTAGAPASAALATNVTLVATGATAPSAAVAALAGQTLQTLTLAAAKLAIAIAAALLLAIGGAVALNTSDKNGDVTSFQKLVTSPFLSPPGYDLRTDYSAWESSGWAIRDDTDQVRAEDGPPARFIVEEANRWHVWIRQLATPVDPAAFPIVRLEYRSTNTASAQSRYALWMDDGTGPNTGGLYYVFPEDIQHDGQAHTLIFDMRKRDHRALLPRGPITTLAVGVNCGEKVPATFELISLTFHPPPAGAGKR